MDTHEHGPSANGHKDAPAFLTRGLAQAARERRQAPRVFHLTHTGGDALVRYVSLTDFGTVDRLPAQLQSRVVRALDEAQGFAPGRADAGPLSVSQGLKALEVNDRLCRLYCLLGFVQPRLVEDEADLHDDDQVWVEDIDPKDRARFMRACEGIETAEADELEPFFPGPAAGVATGGPGGVDRAAPERPAGDAGGGPLADRPAGV